MENSTFSTALRSTLVALLTRAPADATGIDRQEGPSHYRCLTSTWLFRLTLYLRFLASGSQSMSTG